jgi:hypothetical protein
MTGAETAAYDAAIAPWYSKAADYAKQGYDIYSKANKVRNAYNTLRGLGGGQPQPRGAGPIAGGMNRGVPQQYMPQQQPMGGMSGGYGSWRMPSAADAYTRNYLARQRQAGAIS